jgi:hypothetical protein
LFAADEATVTYEPGNLLDLAVETHVQPFNAKHISMLFVFNDAAVSDPGNS